MSYQISLDEIDGCLNVTDGKHTVKVERFATDGIREVYGRTVELLDSENDKLRKELESVGTAAYLYERNDLKDENAKLREDLEFERSENGWAREFLNRMGRKCGTKDCPSLVAYVTKLEAENAKLREKARELWHGHDCGGGCVYFDRCDHPIKDECPMIDSLRELGIEVGE